MLGLGPHYYKKIVWHSDSFEKMGRAWEMAEQKLFR